jgi:hypothetical protein
MATPNAPPPNFEVRVGQYVKLRDMIKANDDAHAEKQKPLKETLVKLNGVMLAHLTSLNADSVATAAGTVSRTTKKSATIADMSAFWSYCVTQGDFDMIDKKANATRVEEYINDKDNNPTGAPPPGVNFTTVDLVGVRRKTGT